MMNEFEYESRPASREGLEEFLAGLRATDSDLVADMGEAAYVAILDHQSMNQAVYWIIKSADNPKRDAVQRKQCKEECKRVAGKLEKHDNSVRVDDIILRYIDRLQVVGERHGKA